MTPRDAEEIRSLHAARVAAELRAADRLDPGADAVAAPQVTFAHIALVKGLRGPAEDAGGPALSGADGAALDLALEALGYRPADAFRTLSRPEPDSDGARVAARLRLQLESVDPDVVIALDPTAARDVAAAYGIEPLAVGAAREVLGRVILAIDDFAASLAREEDKRRVWRQLQKVRKPASSG